MLRILVVLFFLSFATLARADVFHYVDEAGKKHFVDSREKVPAQFRAQLETQKALPAISRSQPGRDKLYEKNTYPGYNGGRVEIFVTSWCPHCKELEAYLTRRQVSFVRYDIERNREGRDKYEQLGGGGVPVIQIGKSTLRGFNPRQVDAALELNN